MVHQDDYDAGIRGVEIPYKAVHCSSCTALRAATGLKASEGKTMAEAWVAAGQSVTVLEVAEMELKIYVLKPEKGMRRERHL